MTTEPCAALPPKERTLPAMLRHAAERFGDRPLLSIAGAAWTPHEAATAAARRGGVLRAAGITCEERVALMCGNFFFQAEDGIRYLYVTGVQTCALPICKVQGYLASVWGVSAVVGPSLGGLFAEYWTWRGIFFINIPLGLAAVAFLQKHLSEEEIGRASCRERV